MDTARIIQMGQQLGLEGGYLRTFVREEQEREREERVAAREEARYVADAAAAAATTADAAATAAAATAAATAAAYAAAAEEAQMVREHEKEMRLLQVEADSVRAHTLDVASSREPLESTRNSGRRGATPRFTPPFSDEKDGVDA